MEEKHDHQENQDNKFEKQAVVISPAGTTTTQFNTGDFILTMGDTFISKLIHFGQGQRFTGEDAMYAKYTHAALIVYPDGRMIEALSEGVRQTHISRYAAKDYVLVRLNVAPHDQAQIITYAESVVGKQYGWFQIAALAVSLASGLRFAAGFDHEAICSGLVAAALERAGECFDKPCNHMLPADLGKKYQVFSNVTAYQQAEPFIARA